MLGALAACGVAETVEGPPGKECILIRGVGETHGDRNRLAGQGDFTFDGELRPGKVGLYLFEMLPGPNGGYHVQTQYQFLWDNGDTFMTSDQVYFEPMFDPGHFKFNVRMNIVSATGTFAATEGSQPIALTADIRFSEPDNPGDLPTVSEEFEVSGLVCR